MTDTARIRDLQARIDGLVRERAAHLERIAALEAEVERLKAQGAQMWQIGNEFDWAAQHDLPPTRAETEADEERD